MSAPRNPVTGGCLCSAGRYELNEVPTKGFYCHRNKFRKNSGSMFQTFCYLRTPPSLSQTGL